MPKMKLRPRERDKTRTGGYSGSGEETVLFDVIRAESAMDTQKPSLCIVKDRQNNIRVAAVYDSDLALDAKQLRWLADQLDKINGEGT